MLKFLHISNTLRIFTSEVKQINTMAQSRKIKLTYLWPNEEFKNVYEYADPQGEIVYEGKIQINKITRIKIFPTAREAAKFVDLTLMKAGKDPINIFKRK